MGLARNKLSFERDDPSPYNKTQLDLAIHSGSNQLAGPLGWFCVRRSNRDRHHTKQSFHDRFNLLSRWCIPGLAGRLTLELGRQRRQPQLGRAGLSPIELVPEEGFEPP